MNYLQFLEKFTNDLKPILRRLPSGSFILNIADAEIEEYKLHHNTEAIENPHIFFQYTVFKSKTELPFSVSIVPQGVEFTLNSAYSFYIHVTDDKNPDYQKAYEWTLLTIRLLLRGQLYVALTMRKEQVVALEVIFKKLQTYKVLITEIDFPLFGDSDDLFIARNRVSLQKEEALPLDYFLYDCTKRVPYRGREISSLEPKRMAKSTAKDIGLKLQYDEALGIKEDSKVVPELFSRVLTWLLFITAVVIVFLLPDGWSAPVGIGISLILFSSILPLVLKPEKNRADKLLEKTLDTFKSIKFDWTSPIAIIITASFFIVDMTLSSGKEVSMFSLQEYTSLIFIPLSMFILLSILTALTNKTSLPVLKFVLMLVGIVTYAVSQELPGNFQVSAETYPDTIMSFISNNIISWTFIILPIVYAFRVWSRYKVRSASKLIND